MKSKAQYFTWLAMVSTAAPATADIIYGSLQQTIPTDYTGVTVTVGSGTLNPFFGGAGVANNNALQPFRLAATGLSTVKNFGTGIAIDSGSGSLATGAGGSTDHLGDTFTDGTEGYVGFRLNNANYGWARVVFTNNTSTPVTPMVKDWAYDNTGAAIKTGWINTDIMSPTAQTVTLNPGTGDAFTLGSVLADASGSITNSVLKTGAGTTTLTGTNTYTGATTVNEGKLVVNGSITGGGTVTVAGGATLGGTGGIAGPVIVNGILSPGASIESLATGTLTLNDLSIFAYEMDSGVAGNDKGDLQIVNGDLTLNGHIDLALSESTFTPNTTTLSMIQYTGALLGVDRFFYGATLLTEGTVFNDGHNNWKISYVAETGGLNFATPIPGSHFITLSNLTAVPEPGSMLAIGCLVGSGAFLRSRRQGRSVISNQ